MADDARQAELRGLLAEALPEDLGPVGLRRRAVPQLGIDAEVTGYGEVLTDALLPVVTAWAEREATRRAAEELTAAISAVQAVYDLQCPVMPSDRYMGAGAYHAHLWWQKVLGGSLRRLRDRAAALTPATEEERPDEAYVSDDGVHFGDFR